jgi:hypothetical protein
MVDPKRKGSGEAKPPGPGYNTEHYLRNLKPPVASKGILQDVRHFFLHNPPIPTLIKFDSSEEQESFSKRILQRTGLEVSKYSILNLHKIGIHAPVQHVFNELLDWSGDSTCWPNHIARVHRVDGKLENIQILLFGKKFPLGILSPLFYMTAIRILRTPTSSDYDNARYLLYECSGGYPIGIFSMFVRSSIPEEQEHGQCQLFMAVGFDFYGRKSKYKRNPINRTWEMVHNRASVNIMNRFKQLCEWRFYKMQTGE